MTTQPAPDPAVIARWQANLRAMLARITANAEAAREREAAAANWLRYGLDKAFGVDFYGIKRTVNEDDGQEHVDYREWVREQNEWTDYQRENG